MGFFGYSAATSQAGRKQPGQPLYKAVVDIDRAIEEAEPLYRLYRVTRMQPNVPAFSGGLLDSWPAVAIEAFEIFRQEEAAVVAHLNSERAHG
jgi:hypothetical protein